MHPPRKPEFFNDDCPLTDEDIPAKWDGGGVRHTGGNIWLRTWSRPLPDGRRLEVGYGSDPKGVGFNHYPDADSHGVDESSGGLAGFRPHLDAEVHSDEGYADAAKSLMRLVNIALGDSV